MTNVHPIIVRNFYSTTLNRSSRTIVMTNVNPIIVSNFSLLFLIDLLTQWFPRYESRRGSLAKSVMSDT